jgi:hypothetical protein
LLLVITLRVLVPLVWLLVAITVGLVAAVLGLLPGTVLRRSKGLEAVLAVS